MEPAAFAAQLISRLENLKREQDTISSLEERLQQIQEVCVTLVLTLKVMFLVCLFLFTHGLFVAFCFIQEEEREDADINGSAPQLSPHPLTLLSGSSDEDPQAILDEHLSRVLKTPGCQSPTVIRHSPRSSSPEHQLFTCTGFGVQTLGRTGTPSSSVSSPDQGAFTLALGPNHTLVSRQSTKHIHHHYIHHHASPKPKEQIEREAALRVHGVCSSGGKCQSCQAYPRSRSLGREMCGAVSLENNMG